MKFQLHSFGESGHSYKIVSGLHFAKADWQRSSSTFFGVKQDRKLIKMK